MRHQVLSPSGMAALPSRTYTHNVASSRFIRDRLVTIHSGIHHYRAVSHVPGHHLSHMSPYRTGHRCPFQHDHEAARRRGCATPTLGHDDSVCRQWASTILSDDGGSYRDRVSTSG